jgi:hypothetical protein
MKHFPLQYLFITEDGGSNSRLIVTRDQSNGSFDSETIAKFIEQIS